MSDVISKKSISLALEPYFDNCKYIQEAMISYTPETNSKKTFAKNLKIDSQISILESCYVKNSGHFNAVEFNICFNQMAYILLVEGINKGLFPGFPDWDISKFKKKQLPDMLILDIKSRFKQEIRAGSFEGSVSLITIKKQKNNIFTKWEILFSDNLGGFASGEALCCAKSSTDII